MVENITNLTNTTILVGTLEVMKNFASEHWEAILVIVGSSGVAGLVFKWYLELKKKKKAKDQIKSRLEQFVSCWEDDKRGGDKKKLRKKMSEIGNELKEVARNIEKLILLPQNILNEANAIAGEIIIFSKRSGVLTVGSDDLSNLIDKQNQKRVEEGDKIAERAKGLIKKL